ncbi:MAG: MBL fold metallo-hydrolase [Bryobacterales bacterium]|nr:MBL fold metallo-hydrolase [Bryobacterales bacterium]
MTEVAPGVLRIDLPLPFAPAQVNVYLVKLAEGWMLVDTGMDSDRSAALLDAALAEAGATGSLRWIVITHCHPDHQALAGVLSERYGARVAMHREEVRALDQILHWETRLQWQEEALRDAGVEPRMIRRVNASFAIVQRTFRPVPVAWVLSGGETFDGAAGPLTVEWTGGHAPGHILLRGPGFVLAGDAILGNGVQPSVTWYPEADPLRDYVAALDRMRDARLPAFCGHGETVPDVPVWAELARKRIFAKEDQMAALLENSPLPLREVAEQVWPERLAPFDYRFAILEARAYAERLQRTGRIRRDSQNRYSISR